MPSLQVNIRAGRLPSPESNGSRYLKIALDTLQTVWDQRFSDTPGGGTQFGWRPEIKGRARLKSEICFMSPWIVANPERFVAVTGLPKCAARPF